MNALSDFEVQIDPFKTGRKITHVELRWWRKDADGGPGRLESSLRKTLTALI